MKDESNQQELENQGLSLTEDTQEANANQKTRKSSLTEDTQGANVNQETKKSSSNQMNLDQVSDEDSLAHNKFLLETKRGELRTINKEGIIIQTELRELNNNIHILKKSLNDIYFKMTYSKNIDFEKHSNEYKTENKKYQDLLGNKSKIIKTLKNNEKNKKKEAIKKDSEIKSLEGLISNQEEAIKIKNTFNNKVKQMSNSENIQYSAPLDINIVLNTIQRNAERDINEAIKNTNNSNIDSKTRPNLNLLHEIIIKIDKIYGVDNPEKIFAKKINNKNQGYEDVPKTIKLEDLKSSYILYQEPKSQEYIEKSQEILKENTITARNKIKGRGFFQRILDAIMRRFMMSTEKVNTLNLLNLLDNLYKTKSIVSLKEIPKDIESEIIKAAQKTNLIEDLKKPNQNHSNDIYNKNLKDKINQPPSIQHRPNGINLNKVGKVGGEFKNIVESKKIKKSKDQNLERSI